MVIGGYTIAGGIDEPHKGEWPRAFATSGYFLTASGATSAASVPIIITWFWAGIILGGSFPRPGPTLRW